MTQFVDWGVSFKALSDIGRLRVLIFSFNCDVSVKLTCSMLIAVWETMEEMVRCHESDKWGQYCELNIPSKYINGYLKLQKQSHSKFLALKRYNKDGMCFTKFKIVSFIRRLRHHSYSLENKCLIT